MKTHMSDSWRALWGTAQRRKGILGNAAYNLLETTQIMILTKENWVVEGKQECNTDVTPHRTVQSSTNVGVKPKSIDNGSLDSPLSFKTFMFKVL